MKNMKKIIVGTGAAIVLLTGCSSAGNIDFSQYITKQMEVTSMEANGVTSIHLNYDEKKVKDQDSRKLLNLFSDIQITTHVVTENKDTVSMEGTLTLKKGKIPFKLFVKGNEVIIQLDNASKPIRIIDKNILPAASKESYAETCKKVIPYLVKHMPTPSTLQVMSKQDKVHNEMVDGHNIHLEVYGNEVPSLVLGLMEGISKDKEAIAVFVRAINEADSSTKVTAESFKKELDTMIGNFKKDLDAAKKDKEFEMLFSKDNYVKSDIFVDNTLHERKSNMKIHVGLPNAEESGVKSVDIETESESWNVNQPVKAQGISASQYLTEEQVTANDGKAFLDTLNKKDSVLYDLLVHDLKITGEKKK
ncbi:hypothetical protein [Aneurinibacillus uraniidurans]|uniref:hypothetical protein n=1 Tax=Aneurinibacillus uraniidurans TaxID=2966586 RepID=UPI00234A6634|nr:hypothetical protein [Aneurinibacillus sp. B1]WCN36242.1 hypothetical protein PO771_10080 [Aneurinibacillus sp. B1]